MPADGVRDAVALRGKEAVAAIDFHASSIYTVDATPRLKGNVYEGARSGVATGASVALAGSVAGRPASC